ncbi:MAG: ATP-binding cassette domain-containing protein [Parachlamydiales bacterium]|nr:ATP-binding cassette domain-containing protein [Parachlamydiales bacterium]
MIKIKDAWKSYGKNQVLKGLNLTIQTGETLVILGRSGVGKSVLLRHIIGLEKLDKGTIEINGHDLYSLKVKDYYEQISQMGMLFQSAALFDSMNVYENVAFYLREHGKPKTHEKYSESEISDIVFHALQMVGLEEAAYKLPSNLSGGMRKRAALARLFAYRPKIVLYDEPTTGLDPITSMQINELICKTQQELQATSIVVTHDIASAQFVGNRLAFHNEGKIELVDTKDNFLRTENPLIKKFLNASLSANTRTMKSID